MIVCIRVVIVNIVLTQSERKSSTNAATRKDRVVVQSDFYNKCTKEQVRAISIVIAVASEESICLSISYCAA